MHYLVQDSNECYAMLHCSPVLTDLISLYL